MRDGLIPTDLVRLKGHEESDVGIVLAPSSDDETEEDSCLVNVHWHRTRASTRDEITTERVCLSFGPRLRCFPPHHARQDRGPPGCSGILIPTDPVRLKGHKEFDVDRAEGVVRCIGRPAAREEGDVQIVRLRQGTWWLIRFVTIHKDADVQTHVRPNCKPSLLATSTNGTDIGPSCIVWCVPPQLGACEA